VANHVIDKPISVFIDYLSFKKGDVAIEASSNKLVYRNMMIDECVRPLIDRDYHVIVLKNTEYSLKECKSIESYTIHLEFE